MKIKIPNMKTVVPKEVPLARPRANRWVYISVGYRCNNDCRFCVAADKRIYRDRTTAEIKDALKEAYAGGIRMVTFTGGECSIREDIIGLVAFARGLGFKVVGLQTNGRAFSSREFSKRMLVAGMTNFWPALHGHTKEVHDGLTRRQGSFRQTVLGIYNIHKLSAGKIPIGTNTVVVKQNYRHLPEIARLLVGLKVDLFQFAFVHATGNAGRDFKRVVPRKIEVAPYIMRGLDVGLKAGKKVWVEAFPSCLLKGYEQYISDPSLPSVELREMGRITSYFEHVRIEREKLKFERCRNCRYDRVCEGPWKQYPEHYGDEEFQPVLSM